MRLALALCFFASVLLAQMFSPSYGPIVQNVGPNAATVWWLDVRSGQGEVVYSTPEGGLFRAAASFKAVAGLNGLFWYSTVLPGLRPGQTVTYQACINNLCTQNKSFKTAPEAGRFSFLVVGDSGSGPLELVEKIATQLAKENASFLIHAGDMTHSTAPLEFFNFLGAYGELLSRLAFWPALGNHDTMDLAGMGLITSLQSLPCQNVPTEGCGRYYSFDWGHAHFVVLDSTDAWQLLPDSRQIVWLGQDLAATKKGWKIVVFHHPPYVTGFHAEDWNSELVRQNIVPILERHNVQLVLSGHEHGYQRTFPLLHDQIAQSNGIVYIVTAGGGSPLYDAEMAWFQIINKKTYNFLWVSVDGAALRIEAVGLEVDDKGNLVRDFRSIDGFEIYAAHAPRRTPPRR